MKSPKMIFIVVVVAIYIMASFTGICYAGPQQPGTTETTTKEFTTHAPGKRATPEKKISKAPKWPWVAAGGLVVALIAILGGGNGGGGNGGTTGPAGSGGGNVEFEW